MNEILCICPLLERVTLQGGNPSEVNNLRPISILPLISKICEKVVHSQVLTYLTSENILTAKQHGFRPSHSTITSLTELTDQIYKAIDNKLVTLVTYLDFAKAFDTINHDLLSQKLRKIGLAEASVSWFKSYLTNRLQMTKANGVTSLPGRITCGVPQGSILGPLLFLIYINDLPTSLTSLQCQLYADDTALYTPCKFPDPDIVPRINADLLNVANWCKKNKLSLNIKKTKYTVYGTRQQIAILPQLNFSIDGQAILQTPHYRYLGLELDSHMNFKSHLNTSQKSLCYKSYLTSKIRYSVTKAAALDIIKSKILPVIDYGHLIYGAGNKGSLDKLQTILNRILRLCFFLDRDAPLDALLKSAEINLLADRREKALTMASFSLCKKWTKLGYKTNPNQDTRCTTCDTNLAKNSHS